MGRADVPAKYELGLSVQFISTSGPSDACHDSPSFYKPACAYAAIFLSPRRCFSIAAIRSSPRSISFRNPENHLHLLSL
jgi:hypothetical protein